MTPEDDPSWPNCSMHGAKHWCDGTRHYFISGKDADDLSDGMRYCVPIVPMTELYAEVSIGQAIVPDMAYELSLVQEGGSFSREETLIPMGLWTRGEGRIQIASTLDDWVAGVAEEKCIASSHGFEIEMRFQQAKKVSDNTAFERANRWCMAYYKMCFFCYNKSKEVQPVASVDFNATSFGLNPEEFKQRGGNDYAARRQQSIQDQLRARFGQ